ncbi:MAG: hypothetical protein WDW36_004032 [Sanguina aurantia]
MAAKSQFYGMEAGIQCWYGDSTTTLAQVTAMGRHPRACNVPCPGDMTGKSMCGANPGPVIGAISIFQLH